MKIPHNLTNSATNPLKIVVIGGGSSYTPELVEGLILRRESLPVRELVFVDVEAGKEKVAINTDLVKRMFAKAEIKTKVSFTLDRRAALNGADFVLTQFRVGGLAARAKDEKIPLSYGMIGQETTGLGGMFKALRTVPVILDICKDMEDLCPQAWLINFTNPSGIVTEAANRFSSIRSIGLCNVPINMFYDVAEKLDTQVSEIDCHFIGLNHLSGIDKVVYKGQDVTDQVLSVEKEEGLVKNIEKIDQADRFAQISKIIPSPYLQYFFFEKEMLEEEKEAFSGGGTRAEQVMKVEADLFEKYKNPNLNEKPKELEERGGARYSEAAIDLIDSIYNNRKDVQVINVLNGNTVPSLPADASIETNCLITDHGPLPLPGGQIPDLLEGLMIQVKLYERLTIEAALSGDRDLALKAAMANPLVHSVTDAKACIDELIEAHKDFLPQFL